VSANAAVSILIFLSGATGLVYEVVWAKQLALVLGGTALAQTAVLGLFLAGLAAGNALFGPIVDRSPSPLRLYAKLEFAIAALGALSPLLLRYCDGFFGAALVLLPPTVLMGGTLPALTRWRVRGLEGLRPGLGLLYGLNSGGAVLGALGAGFVLVPEFGLDTPLLGTAAVNLAIGIAALRVDDPKTAPLGTAETQDAAPIDRAVLPAVFLAGAASLVYEIAWIRILALSLGASAYAFSLMLSAFITGITLGSFWAARSKTRLEAGAGFALSQLGVVAAVAVCALLYERLPYYSLLLQSGLDRSPENFALFSTLRFAFCVLALLPPTFFIGAQLPWAVRAATRSADTVGRGVGAVFSWNTIGNVAGAAAAGLWLMPWLGLRGLLLVGMALNAAAAPLVWRGRAAWTPAAIAIVAAIAVPRFDSAALTSGAYRLRAPEGLSFQAFRDAHAREKILFYKDDREGTVTVTEDEAGVRFLKVNGKSDASTGEDMRTQELLAALPLALRPDAKRALIVGLGSGVTAGEALKRPLERLDVVEISPAVAEAERFFRGVNGEPLSDTRLALHLQDAKAFLESEGEPYDAIISEPSNPWIAGIGNLFTVEFYSRAKTRLAPDGIFVQWFHLYEMSDEVLRLVLRTFASSFEHVSLWEVGSNDILLLGSASPIAPPRSPGLEPLLSLESLSDRAVRAAAGEGPVNRDRRPLLEHQAPRALFLDEQTDMLARYDERLDPRNAGALLLPRYMNGRPLDKATLAAILREHAAFKGPVYERLAAEWRRRYPDPVP
jgi:predicted membrane-bound spermidine synthase